MEDKSYSLAIILALIVACTIIGIVLWFYILNHKVKKEKMAYDLLHKTPGEVKRSILNSIAYELTEVQSKCDAGIIKEKNKKKIVLKKLSDYSLYDISLLYDRVIPYFDSWRRINYNSPLNEFCGYYHNIAQNSENDPLSDRFILSKRSTDTPLLLGESNHTNSSLVEEVQKIYEAINKMNIKEK